MDSYNGFYNWKYTETKSEIPKKITTQLGELPDSIRVAAWVDQFMKKADSFVVITAVRVIAKSGYATPVFSVTHMPVIDLIDRAHAVIEHFWNKQREAA
jgi:hypothetical protein